jgi:hypothetical protein
MTITKALIIDEPWLSKILNGEKDWEMRSTNAKHRGLFGLIRKGSGKIYGVANLSNVSGPYSNEQLAAHLKHHHVGADMIENPDYKWRYAWELKDVRKLEKAVPYQHKSGAVTWVTLDDAAVSMLNSDSSNLLSSVEIDSASSLEVNQKASAIDTSLEKTKIRKLSLVDETSSGKMTSSDYVPAAKDGSCFSKCTCNNKGIYTVGEKRYEKKFRCFDEALSYLKGMPTAKWRRPNSKGNWGIVSAVRWIKPTT